MNKKVYICPDMQVIDIDVKTSLMAISGDDATLDIDAGGDHTIDNEEGAFSRDNNTNLWDKMW